jgi:hypothetical protein
VLRKDANLNAGRPSTPIVELLNGFVLSGLRESSPNALPV